MKHRCIRILCLSLSLILFFSSAFAYTKLEKGMKGAEVLAMQKALKALGYPITLDGSYGIATENVVRSFQRNHSLSVDGIAGNATLSLLYSLAPSATTAPTFTPKPTTAPAVGPVVTSTTAYVSTASGSLNLRRTASAGNNIIGSVPNHAQVTVLSRNSKWCFISYNGLTGYVMTEYLSFSTPTAVPTLSPTKTPVITAAPQASGITATVSTVSGSLNLRRTPSSGNNIIGTIPNHAKVTVTARGSEWCAVTYGSLSGYVLTSFLSFTTAATTAPTQTPAPTKIPVPTATAAQGNLSATINTGNGSLNLRRTPAFGNNIIGSIPDRAQVRVLDRGVTWSTVSYLGLTGYVMTSYLSFTSAVTPTPVPTATPSLPLNPTTAPASSLIAYVKTESGSLNLRAQGATNGTLIGRIPNGTQIRVLQRGDTWCAVIYNGISGYVMTSFLYFPQSTVVPAPTATVAPTAPPVQGQSIACVTTSGGSLNLRDRPNGNVIAYIPNGTGIIVTNRDTAWCAVQYSGISGYVMTSFLTFLQTPSATAAPTQTPGGSTAASTYAVVTTTGGSLNLRAEKSTSAKVIDGIANGETLLVTSRGDTWCAVTYNGISGYVMTKYLTFTATPPKPADDTPIDPSQYKRTLKKGMVGADVEWVQSRLKTLEYEVSLTGTYDDQTISAVKHFQSQNGLSTDGLSGSQTFAMLRSSNARKATDAPLTYDTLRIDDEGPAVTSMQKALKALGYPVTVSGEYDVSTHNAVVAFQQRNELVISGIAYSLTRQLIHSENAKPYATPVESLPADAGVIDGPAVSEIKLLHWQNEIRDNVKDGQTYLIFDPNTHISWNLKFYSLGRHADSQPATWRDTQLMNRAFGTSSWTIHPVYVLLPTGQWTMATMHNRPHLYGSIDDNGFGGHLCVHFLRDMEEAQRNDPNYGVNNQKTLRNAWKALTGETVN